MLSLLLLAVLAEAPLAPELRGLGTLTMPVTTAVPAAQRFFDQGVRLLYAFNHPEALRAFREAARLDPTLAMAHWGQALAVGPNLNAPLTKENNAVALAALARARALKAHAGPRERALIDALAARFSANPRADRKKLDQVYADAMAKVAAAYPDDSNVQTLYADAIMNVSPWDYWQADGRAKPLPALAIATLERVLAADPNHAGALHYHIHALEASTEPERAETSADRLGSLMPAAGHMVHMPAHIYIRTGRYADAAEANVRAIEADENYLAQCQAQGLYPVSYYPHNLHFLWAAATFEGRGAVAIDAARRVAQKVPHHHAGALAWTADFPVTPMLAYARFGQWREALTEPKPPAREPYAIGIWHYMRALAFTARRDLDRAAAEVAALETVLAHEAFTTTLKDYPMLPVLQIASRMARGELQARRGNLAEGIRLLQEAATMEDALPYSEPPLWHHPPRQVLGALLLDAGRAAEAERAYREDLQRFRENGWSLFGLMRALEAQGRGEEAAAVKGRYEKAFVRADITLTSSRIMEDDRAVASGFSRNITLKTGVTLEYVQQGDRAGTPVIFLHGITDSWRSFEPLLPHLPRSINAWAVTLRGHGDSDKPQGDYTPATFAGDVDAFMDAHDIASAIIVGHSMSTAVAQQLALDYPSRVRGLVLIGGTADWAGAAITRELTAAFANLREPLDPSFVRDFQASTAAKPIAGIIDTATAESLKVPARVWTAAMQGLAGFDVRAQLPALRVPALIMFGSRENVVTRADQDVFTQRLASARLVVFDGLGHAVHWDDPAGVGEELVAFVEQVSSREKAQGPRHTAQHKH